MPYIVYFITFFCKLQVLFLWKYNKLFPLGNDYLVFGLFAGPITEIIVEICSIC